MDWTTILGSISGGVLGFAGGIVQKFVSIYEEKKKHEMEMQRLEFQGKLDVQKADLNLRQTQEDRAGEAFSKAIDAQSGLTGSTPWVKDVLALYRPGLTTLLLIIASVLFFFVEADTQDYLVLAIISLAQLAAGYWFGQRSFEKANIRMAKR